MMENISLPARTRKTLAARYAISLLAVALALGVGRALAPVLGGSMPYVALFPAIAFCAWYCGLGPSILSSTMALVVLYYSFLAPAYDLITFGVAAAIIIAI